jgi:GNAT superfamily N-acetyltransferase
VSVHVAQVNIATIRAPVGDPLVAEFVDNLDRINAIADSAPGFRWRLQTEEGNATSIHAFPDPMLLVNMSVWESVEALQEFAYRTEHREFVKRRASWFVEGSTRLALWWVPEGAVPTVEEAKRRLAFLAAYGPSPYAFRFGKTPPQALVSRTTFADETTVALIHRLNDELSAMYPEEGANHFTLDPESVIPPVGVMVRATLDGRPIACGAIRMLDARTGELKRMYVDPEARGLKLGAAILDSLEHEAASLGVEELCLETGSRQTAAIALYEKAGYAPTALWGEYLRSPETSRCYRKSLAVEDGLST